MSTPFPQSPFDSPAFAQSFGFESVGTLSASALVAREDVRDMCAADRCHAYGKNWACPPGCGDIDSFQKLFESRDRAIIVQTVRTLEDEFDIEGMEEAVTLHKERFDAYAEEVRKARSKAKEGSSGAEEVAPLFLTAGACTICPTCSYPSEPCRFPERALVSMEASGLLVSEVCTLAEMEYYHGKGTISYTGCVLF